jgi:hypothetical protein
MRSQAAGVALLTCCLLIMGCLGCAHRPSEVLFRSEEHSRLVCHGWSPNGELIAVTAYPPAGPARTGKLYAVRASSGRGTFVGMSSSYFAPPQWSSDGQQLLMVPAQSRNLVMTDVTSGEATEVYQTPQGDWIGDLSLSPDGKVVAILLDKGEGCCLVEMELSSGREREIWTEPAGNAYSAGLQWTPDSQRLIWCWTSVAQASMHLCLHKRGSAGFTTLDSLPDAFAISQHCCAGDAERLAIVDRSGQQHEIRIVDVGSRTLSRVIRLAGHVPPGAQPIWSGLDRSLVYGELGRSPNGSEQILLRAVKADGTDLRTLTTIGNCDGLGAMAYSPKEQLVAVAEGNSLRLVATSGETDDQRQ